MKKSFLGILALTLIFGLAVIGCGDGDNNGNENGNGGNSNGNGNGNNGNNNSNLRSLNIIGAKNLFIASVSGQPLQSINARSVGNESQNKLFKITEYGVIQEITYNYEDDEGNPIQSNETLIPTDIFNINQDYLMVVFTDSIYLLRKTDGAVFLYSDSSWNNKPSLNDVYVSNRRSILNDNNGNIYFLANDKVIKVNVQNPSSITRENYSPDSDRVWGFEMDNNGNIIYFGRDSGNSEISRIRRSGGSLRNLSSQNARFAWTGLDNSNFYFFDRNSTNSGTQIKKWISGTNEIEDFGIDMVGFSGFGGNGYILKTSGRIITISVLQNSVYEIYPEFSPIQGYASYDPNYMALGLNSIKYADSSGDYYYITGNNTSENPVLLKINAATDVPTTILSGYDVYKFTVTEDNIVTFNALNMDNGKKVIGSISSNNIVTILDETLNIELTVLERIN